MPISIKTVIFDFGNVVAFFDYGPAFRKLRALTTLSADEIREALEASGLPDAFETGHINADEFLARITEVCRFHPDCDRGALVAAWSDIFTPNPDVCELFPRLKPRYRLLLGSNTNELHARQFRRQFADVFRHFDDFVLSYEVGAMKPKEEFFLRCVELAGCAPKECVFIDDLAANIEGARACGLQGIVYKDGTVREALQELGVDW